MLSAAFDIKKTFVNCPVQKIAYDALTADILNCDFAWTSTVGTQKVVSKIDINDYEHAMWTEFVRSLVMELCLYGFAIYRLAKVPRGISLETREISTKRHRKYKSRFRKLPQVANGQQVVLRWNDITQEWMPYGDSGKPFSRDDGWRMIMSSPPVKWGSGSTPIYKSFAAASTTLSQAYRQIRENVEVRDNINTEIGVYTQMMKNLMAPGSGMSTKPWFQPSVHGAMSAAPGDLHQPFEMKVADRLEAAMGLKTATDKFRVFSEDAPIGRSGKVEPPAERPARHTEHIITDGFESREVSYRRAPEDLIRIMDMLFNLILFS